MPLPRFCPDCGARVERVDGGAARCPACGRPWFANSKPATGVFIEREGKLLLVRRGVEPGKGRWDVPGGYLEEGELPEHGARREVREELGLELGAIRLVQTDVNLLEDGAVLDLLFETADLRGEPRPASDVAACEWFDPGALPLEDLAFASTRRIVERWRAARRPRPLRLLAGELPALAHGSRRWGWEAPGEVLPPGARIESGTWRIEGGMLCGQIDGERPAVLWLEPEVEGDHLVAFDAWTVPPHAQDINCYWEGSGHILGAGDVACTIGGIGGWWSGLTGIERYPEGGLRATARLAPTEPGRRYQVVAGRWGASDFLFIDGELAMEIEDPALPRRARSRIALSTWNSHVHFARVAVHGLAPRR